MRTSPNILVVGAGASGLAFALACAHHGLQVRIIDKRPARSHIQKATGVALGIWQQLAAYGITPNIIGDAFPMRHFVFHEDQRLIADITVPLIKGQAPAHLYPQADLEQAMENALAALDVRVDYGLECTDVRQGNDKAHATLKHADESTETQACDWLIAADGSHSQIRSQLGLPFIGHDYPESWSVAEISTQHWPESIQAQLHLGSDGIGLFLSQPKRGNIQGIVNAPGAAQRLQALFPDAQLHYERAFRVALRRVATPRHGRVWLIGDAAHVQSPVGGQGLNLAIWDGITLGNALMRGEEQVAERLAKRARRVLFFTDFDYRMLATRSRTLRGLRNAYWAQAAKHPRLARWFFKLISGVW